MENGGTSLTAATRSVQRFKIDGFSVTGTMTTSDYIKSSWSIDGYGWEVRLYPSYFTSASNSWVALKLIFLSEAREHKVRASLSCWLVDPTGRLGPSEQKRRVCPQYSLNPKLSHVRFSLCKDVMYQHRVTSGEIP